MQLLVGVIMVGLGLVFLIVAVTGSQGKVWQAITMHTAPAAAPVPQTPASPGASSAAGAIGGFAGGVTPPVGSVA